MKLGAFIIPTGIGASIGGFAGDASIWARRFAKKCNLIVNPNVVNAACFSGITDNMLYVEGYSLDNFFQGKINLMKSENNKIGIIFDKAIKKDILNIHINTINAVKTVYGINIIDHTITKEEVGVEFNIDNSGASVGNISNLDTLREAAVTIVKKGAEAIAIVCRFPEDDAEDLYSKGIGVDPVGGAEAIISHYISKEFNLPCAHAPAFDNVDITSEIVDSRCASEYITPTYLPCILLGLSQAPRFTNNNKYIKIDDLEFLITPYNAIGSIPVLEMIKRNKPVYAIKENKTVLNVTPENFISNCSVFDTYQDLYYYLFK